MAYDAGAIESRLLLDRAQFNRELDAARADAERFANQDFSAGVGVNAGNAQAQIDQVRAGLDKLASDRADPSVHLDDEEALARLNELRAKLDELGAKSVDIDTEKAQEHLKELKDKSDEAAGSSLGGGVSGLIAAGLALGPALIPVAATATAGIGALSSVIGTAGIGLGSFAALAIPAFQGVGKEVQTITKDQAALNAAVGDKAKLQALQQLTQDYAKIPEVQRPVVQGVLDFEQALRDTAKQVQPQVYDAFFSFLNAGRSLLPQLVGPAQQAGLALSDMGKGLQRDFQSQNFAVFMNFVSQNTRGAIDAIGTSIGNLAKGFGFLLEDFAPLIPAIEGGMKRITAAFANWAQNLGGSQGFQNFLQYVHENAKPVGDAIKNIADALVGIVRASAGLGGIEIRALADLAGALNALVKVPGLGPVIVDIGLLALAVGKLSNIGFVAKALAAFGDALKGLFFASGVKTALAGLPEEIAATGAASEVAAGRVFGFAGGAKGAASEAEGLGSKAAGATGLLGGLGGASEGLVGALIPLAPALVAVAGGAGLVALAVDGLHNNYAGMVQVVSTGEPILSDASLKIDGVRQAAQRLNDEAANAGPAFRGLVGQIDQALGNLAPDLANKGIQAEQALATAIKNGQAPNMASLDAKNILDAYNQLLQIPGIGAQVMGALSSTIDSHGKQLGQVVLDQVHNLVGEYGQLAPDVQQQVLKAMSDLQAGLATGNQGMINNAKAQLALLTGAYGAAGANIVQTGNAAFGQMVTDVEAHTSQMNQTAQASVAFLKGLYNTLPAPVQQAANLAMQSLDDALKSGNQTAITTAESAVNTVLVDYAKMPPGVQQQVSAAMQELDTGIATGNQNAINDATTKLAQLESTYQGAVAPIGAAGGAASADYVRAMDDPLNTNLGTLQGIMSQYDATLAGGINPIIESTGGKPVAVAIGGVGGAGGANVAGARATGGMLVDHPMFVVGEEAPTHKEVVISENPAYHARNIGLLHQAAGMLGVTGLQQGGFMDPSQVPPPPSAQLLAFGSIPQSFGSATNIAATNEYNIVKAWAAAQAAAAAAVSSSGGSPFGGGPIKDYMLGEVAKRWPGPAEAAAFDYVEMREAGYDPNAQNPTSSAAGLAQNISGFGPGYERGNVQQQTAWMLNYIAGRYGDPIGAAAHERAFNWYGDGGIFTSPQIIGVGDKGPEAVVPLGQGGAFGGNVTIDARIVFQGDVTDNIDARIQRAHAAQADRITRKLGLHGYNPAPGGNLR